MVGVKGKKMRVRGKWVSFNRETIIETFNLKVQKDGSKIKKLLKDPKYQKIVDLLTGEKENGRQQGKPHMNPLPEAL